MKRSKKIFAAYALFFMMLLALCSVSVSAAEAGWKKVGTSYKWMQEDGSYCTKTGWQTLGGKRYYLNADGTMKTGWLTYGGKKYYLSNSSSLKVKGTKLTGKNKIGTKYYYFSAKSATLGQQQFGVVAVGGKYYYFDKKDSGAMLVDKWVSTYYYGSDGARKTGLQKIGKYNYYLGSDGKKVTNKNGIKIGSYYYKISSSGICTKVSEAMGLAGIQLDKLGMGTNKEQNLKKAFDWCTKIRYRAVAAPSAGKNVAEYYAVYGFKTKPGWGDCNVQAATFYCMAKVLGYKDITMVQGKVPQKNNTWGAHAWCEIKVGTQYYFYDPNAAQAKNVGWKFLYGTPKSYVYKDAHNHVVQYKK